MFTQRNLFRWHLWLGLASGCFLLLIGVSGSIAVFIEEIDWLVTPSLRHRAPADAPRADADALLASVQAAYPGARVTTLHLSGRPAFAHVAKVQDGRRNLDVFLDPVSAQVKGDRVVSSAYTSTLRNFIRQFHVRLLMGLWGRVFVGVFGVTLVLSCVTGLWIYRAWFKNLFRLRWRARGERTRWSDLHKLVGLWSLIFNLLIGLTGAVLGLENLTNQIRRHWLRPADGADAAPPTSLPNRAARPDSPPLPVATLLTHARTAFPDLAVRSVILPGRSHSPIVLRGDVPSPLVMQSHVRRANFISLDPYTGDVIRRVDGREARGWARVYSTFDPLHFGYFGGMTTKVIWFILGLTPGVLSLTGAWLWWRRQPRRKPSSRAAPASPRSRFVILTVALGTGITLALAGLISARAHGGWSAVDKLIEHGLAKPVALALVAFPLTAALVWLAGRLRTRPAPFAAAIGLCAGWYLVLVTLFQ